MCVLPLQLQHQRLLNDASRVRLREEVLEEEEDGSSFCNRDNALLVGKEAKLQAFGGINSSQHSLFYDEDVVRELCFERLKADPRSKIKNRDQFTLYWYKGKARDRRSRSKDTSRHGGRVVLDEAVKNHAAKMRCAAIKAFSRNRGLPCFDPRGDLTADELNAMVEAWTSVMKGLYDDSFMDEEEIPLGKPAIAAAFAAALAPHKLTPTKGHIVPDVSPVKATLEQAGTIIDAIRYRGQDPALRGEQVGMSRDLAKRVEAVLLREKLAKLSPELLANMLVEVVDHGHTHWLTESVQLAVDQRLKTMAEAAADVGAEAEGETDGEGDEYDDMPGLEDGEV